MFTGRNLKLAHLMGSSVVVAALGMQALGLLGNRTIAGQEIKVHQKPLYWGKVAGGLGLIWAYEARAQRNATPVSL